MFVYVPPVVLPAQALHNKTKKTTQPTRKRERENTERERERTKTAPVPGTAFAGSLLFPETTKRQRHACPHFVCIEKHKITFLAERISYWESYGLDFFLGIPTVGILS